MVEELLNCQVDAQGHLAILGLGEGGRKFCEEERARRLEEGTEGTDGGAAVLTCAAMKTRIGDRDFSYAVTGEGRAVILVHAFPLDGRMWQETAAGLAGKCRVIAPDMRGFGASDLGDGSHSIADMADDVAALMDHLGLAQATVGGMSMGGYVALAFAARHRERLEGLILADTRAAPDSDAARAARADALVLVETQGVAPYVERQLPGLLSLAAGDDVRGRVRAIAQQKPDGVCAGIRALRDRPDRRGELSAIGCPTLVIAGSDDKISPPAEMAEIARAISGARFAEIAGAGHLSNLEKPAEFVAAIADFI
jgi:3-oxoadipate enol-lactonase